MVDRVDQNTLPCNTQHREHCDYQHCVMDSECYEIDIPFHIAGCDPGLHLHSACDQDHLDRQRWYRQPNDETSEYTHTMAMDTGDHMYAKQCVICARNMVTISSNP